MKNAMHWGWVALVLVGLLLGIYYFGFPFLHPYYFGGWRYRTFGPGMWPAFPFSGMLILILLGFILYRLLFSVFPRKTAPPTEGWTFCPHCGADLRQAGKAETKKEE